MSLYNVQSNILLFKYAVSDQTKMNILVLDDFLKNTISFLRWIFFSNQSFISKESKSSTVELEKRGFCFKFIVNYFLLFSLGDGSVHNHMHSTFIIVSHQTFGKSKSATNTICSYVEMGNGPPEKLIVVDFDLEMLKYGWYICSKPGLWRTQKKLNWLIMTLI